MKWPLKGGWDPGLEVQLLREPSPWISSHSVIKRQNEVLASPLWLGAIPEVCQLPLPPHFAEEILPIPLACHLSGGSLHFPEHPSVTTETGVRM